MDESSCAVCLEALEPAAGTELPVELGELSCHHVYHLLCISLWATESCTLCPLDRREFDHVNVKEKIAGKVLRTVRFERKVQRHVEHAEHGEEDGDLSRYDLTDCRICHRCDREDVMLLCDGCEDGYHTDCLGLEGIPEGEWFCQLCESIRETARVDEERRRSRRPAANSETGAAVAAQSEPHPAARPRTLRTSAAIRGASASEIRVLRMRARAQRRRMERNARLNSLELLDGAGGEREPLSESEEGSGADSAEESDFSGSDDGAPHGSPRMSARLREPRRSEPRQPVAARGSASRNIKQKRSETSGPFPDYRFDRPLAPIKQASKKRKRKRTTTEGLPELKGPSDVERFLWRQLKIAQAALDPATDQNPRSAAGGRNQGRKGEKPGAGDDPLVGHRASATRLYSHSTYVVPSYSRNHEVPVAKPSSAARQGLAPEPDPLSSILDEQDTSSSSFLKFLKERRTASDAEHTTPGSTVAVMASGRAQSAGESHSAVSQQAQYKDVSVNSASNGTAQPAGNEKERIFRIVKPRLQPLYERKLIDKAAFQSIARAVTQTIYLGVRGGPFDESEVAEMASARIKQHMVDAGIRMPATV